MHKIKSTDYGGRLKVRKLSYCQLNSVLYQIVLRQQPNAEEQLVEYCTL
jgi:hypothetical protein